MKQFLAVSFFLSLTISNGQKLKNQKWGHEFYQQSFTVLKSDKSVRHGTYSCSKNGKLNISGNYSNNKKVGEWKYYENENLVQIYDYTLDSLISRTESGAAYLVFDGNNYITKELEIEPSYIGGNVGLERELNDVMEYPQSTRRIGLEGDIKFSIDIDATGTIMNVNFINGPKSKFPDGSLNDLHIAGVQDLFNEIKNGLMKIDQLWIPGLEDKIKYQCRLNYTMEFRLIMCGNYGCSTMFLK